MQENNIESIRRIFWERLEVLLIEKGITKREEQWEYLGVSKSTLLNWKNGLALLGHLDLVRIANLLGCSVDYLIDEKVTVKTAAAEVQAAIKTTGLSEQAVTILQACQISGAAEILNTISSMIVSDVRLYQMKDGKWENGNRPDPWNKLTSHIGNGAAIQGTGLIAALQNNLEASIVFENEREKLLKMPKDNTDREEMRELILQHDKTDAAQTRLKVSGYEMTVACSMATAEGQQYHETLKAEYMKGGRKNGEYNGKD